MNTCHSLFFRDTTNTLKTRFLEWLLLTEVVRGEQSQTLFFGILRWKERIKTYGNFSLLIGALLSARNCWRACRNQRDTTPAGLVSESRDRFDSPNQALSCGGTSCHNVKGRDRWTRESTSRRKGRQIIYYFSACVLPLGGVIALNRCHSRHFSSTD